MIVISARLESPKTTFFTLGDHHDFGVSAAWRSDPQAVATVAPLSL
jgi:hypothetical protein